VKDIRATAWGIEVEPIMWPDVPRTRGEIEQLRDVIHSNEMIWGQLVSRDDRAALITAAFLEDWRDYRYIFNRLMPLLKSLEDEDTEIWAAGEPILYGWIYHYLPHICAVMAVTVVAMVVVLAAYLRRAEGVVIPMTSVFLTATWGLGFTQLLGFNFDPLTLVIPFVIAARTMSHSVQMAERFDAELRRLGDKKLAASAALEALIPPAVVSIVTDACGVLIIATAPIPLLQKLGISGCLWMLTDLVSVLVMAPILYTFFPLAPHEERRGRGLMDVVLLRTNPWCLGRGRWAIIAGAALAVAWSACELPRLTVGDAHPGSPLLWPDSPYNQSVKHINQRFPGLDQLGIIVAGDRPNAMKSPQVVEAIEELERYMLEHPRVGGTALVTQLLKKMNVTLHYDHPFWAMLPSDPYEVAGLLQMVQECSEPGDFDKWVSYDFKDSNIIVYCKDHRGETIRSVIRRAKEFIERHPVEGARFRLACGLIGILAAANEEIARTHEFNLVAILSFTYLMCALAYRSFFGGLFFVLSLIIANFFTLATMAALQIGLNVNTVPVVSLGVGLGVDYGLYVVSRIKDEYRRGGDLSGAILTSRTTAGKAVLYTATLITLALIFWWFSPLRFQAEMGLLLCLVLVMNLLGAMLLLPSLISLIRPRFVVGGEGRQAGGRP